MTFRLPTKAPASNTARETSPFANTAYIQERTSFKATEIKTATHFSNINDLWINSKFADINNLSCLAGSKMF